MMQDMKQDGGAALAERGSQDEHDEEAKWRPASNHPWRQYRSVYLQKKRMEYLRQHAPAECV